MKRRQFVAIAGVSTTAGCLRAQNGTGEDEADSQSNTSGNRTEPSETSEPSDRLENAPGEPISTVELTKTWESDDEVFEVTQKRGSFFVYTLSEILRVETDGTVTWQVETPEDHAFELNSLVIGDETIYVGTSYQGEGDPHARLYAFDANGEVLWFDRTASTGTRTRIDHVSLGSDFVTYGSDTSGSDVDQNSVVRVIERESGEARWSKEFPEAFSVGVASTDEQIVAATTDGVSLFDVEGNPTGEFSRQPTFRGVASHENVAYISGGNPPTLGALNLQTGEFSWTKEISRRHTRGGIAVSERALVFGDQSGSVFCLDPKSGGQFWESRVGASVPDRISPVFNGNRVWVSDERGSVYALSLRGGTIVYEERLSTEDPVQVAAIDDVVLITADNTAYAVDES